MNIIGYVVAITMMGSNGMETETTSEMYETDTYGGKPKFALAECAKGLEGRAAGAFVAYSCHPIQDG